MADKVDIFIPIYIGDYLADTSDLNAEEHGAYLLILMHMWRAREALPLARLDRVARVARQDWDRVWGVIERFFDVENGMVTQGRLMRQLADSLEKKQGAIHRGRQGGLARAQAEAERKLARSLDQAETEQGSSSAQGQAEPKHARLTLTDLGSGDQTPDPSRPPDRDLPARSDVRAKTAMDWQRTFARSWVAKYGGLAMGGGSGVSKATGELHDRLAAMPGPDRAAAEARENLMISDYLDNEAPYLVDARHPWALFVSKFDQLRVPKVVVAPPRPGPIPESFLERDARVAREAAAQTARELADSVAQTEKYLAKKTFDVSKIPTAEELKALRLERKPPPPQSPSPGGAS